MSNAEVCIVYILPNGTEVPRDLYRELRRQVEAAIQWLPPGVTCAIGDLVTPEFWLPRGEIHAQQTRAMSRVLGRPKANSRSSSSGPRVGPTSATDFASRRSIGGRHVPAAIRAPPASPAAARPNTSGHVGHPSKVSLNSGVSRTARPPINWPISCQETEMKIELSQDMINRGELKCPDDRRKIEYCDAGPNGVPGLLLEVRASSRPEKRRGSCDIRTGMRERHTCDWELPKNDRSARLEKSPENSAHVLCWALTPEQKPRHGRPCITYSEFFESALPAAREAAGSDRGTGTRSCTGCASGPAFGNKRLNEITRHQVQTFHSELAAQGLAAATANHHLKVLRYSLNLARQLGDARWREPGGAHPDAARGQQGRALPRRRGAAAPAAGPANGPNRAVCAIALFLLSTGCRLNEALSATWADVDVERRVFTIRATNSKSRKLRSVPAQRQRHRGARQSRDQRATDGPLFVSSQTGQGVHHDRKVVGPHPESGRAAAPAAARPAAPVRELPRQRRADAVRGPGDPGPLEQQGDRALRPPEHEDVAGRGEQRVGEAQRGEVERVGRRRSRHRCEQRAGRFAIALAKARDIRRALKDKRGA